jgi:hypothetical protein
MLYVEQYGKRSSKIIKRSRITSSIAFNQLNKGIELKR